MAVSCNSGQTGLHNLSDHSFIPTRYTDDAHERRHMGWVAEFEMCADLVVVGSGDGIWGWLD